MLIQPYLFFEGRCEEAIKFYEKALGAKVEMLMRMKEAPPGGPPMAPGNEDKVLHASFKIGESVVMASDGMCNGGETKLQGAALSLSVKDEAEAKTTFAALSAGGQVGMPLGPTFFSPSFGMCTDRFGVAWMVIVPQA